MSEVVGERSVDLEALARRGKAIMGLGLQGLRRTFAGEQGENDQTAIASTGILEPTPSPQQPSPEVREGLHWQPTLSLKMSKKYNYRRINLGESQDS